MPSGKRQPEPRKGTKIDTLIGQPLAVASATKGESHQGGGLMQPFKQLFRRRWLLVSLSVCSLFSMASSAHVFNIRVLRTGSGLGHRHPG